MNVIRVNELSESKGWELLGVATTDTKTVALNKVREGEYATHLVYRDNNKDDGSVCYEIGDYYETYKEAVKGFCERLDRF